jgi:dTDP-glucose 4,6-dehydratase
VYGTAIEVPIHERHPLQAQSPYAATKTAADKLVEAFHRSYGLPTVTVRPFNAFGPRQSTRAIVPTIITQCLRNSVLRLGATHPTRDLNFVEDIVDGFVRAAQVDEAVGRTFNLGSGREISIAALAKLIAQLMGVSASVEVDDDRVRPRRSEVERLIADAGEARSVLGWLSTTPLEEGLKQTIEWIAANHSETAHFGYRI